MARLRLFRVYWQKKLKQTVLVESLGVDIGQFRFFYDDEKSSFPKNLWTLYRTIEGIKNVTQIPTEATQSQHFEFEKKIFVLLTKRC